MLLVIIDTAPDKGILQKVMSSISGFVNISAANVKKNTIKGTTLISNSDLKQDKMDCDFPKAL